jgi:hypothetical protein
MFRDLAKLLIELFLSAIERFEIEPLKENQQELGNILLNKR